MVARLVRASHMPAMSAIVCARSSAGLCGEGGGYAAADSAQRDAHVDSKNCFSCSTSRCVGQ